MLTIAFNPKKKITDVIPSNAVSIRLRSNFISAVFNSISKSWFQTIRMIKTMSGFKNLGDRGRRTFLNWEREHIIRLTEASRRRFLSVAAQCQLAINNRQVPREKHRQTFGTRICNERTLV